MFVASSEASQSPSPLRQVSRALPTPYGEMRFVVAFAPLVNSFPCQLMSARAVSDEPPASANSYCVPRLNFKGGMKGGSMPYCGPAGRVGPPASGLMYVYLKLR